MFGWSISASAWRSASNRAITCFVSIPGLMILSATLRRTGLHLLGHVDHAHAAFADRFEQLVRADDRAGTFVPRRLLDRGARISRGRFEELLDLRIGGQQLLNLASELSIIAASLVKVPRTLLGRLDGECRPEDGLGFLIRSHHGPALNGVCSISRSEKGVGRASRARQNFLIPGDARSVRTFFGRRPNRTGDFASGSSTVTRG